MLRIYTGFLTKIVTSKERRATLRMDVGIPDSNLLWLLFKSLYWLQIPWVYRKYSQQLVSWSY